MLMGRPRPIYARNTSEPIAPGMASDMRSITTDTICGSRFFIITRRVGVPRQRDARLKSRSRMIMTWLRIKRARPIQPVRLIAIIIVCTLGLIT